MGNRKLQVSATGKEILDSICERLEIDRPQGIKIALAKGLVNGIWGNHSFEDGKPKWTMPDSIIRDHDYLLFKHIIINEQGRTMSDEEINQYILLYFEVGLRIVNKELENLTSLEDARIKILG